MSITCSSCGKTNIPYGTTQCPVCHRVFSPAPQPTNTSSSFGKPILVDARGRRYSLNSTAAAIIGSRGCAILLGDPGVPDQAARLIPNGNGFLLEDICGAVTVNGGAVPTSRALQNGDKISIGSALLTYQGPSSVSMPVTPSPVVSPPQTIKAVAVTKPPQPLPPPPPPPPMKYTSSPQGISLKSWGSTPPIVEGYVEIVDGPHRVDKGSLGGKIVTSLALNVISSTLAMMPFWLRQEISVWYLRIKDHSTGRMVSVVMRGEPGSLPQLGDFIAVWGSTKNGNVLMKSGYSYTTDSEIRLKK